MATSTYNNNVKIGVEIGVKMCVCVVGKVDRYQVHFYRVEDAFSALFHMMRMGKGNLLVFPQNLIANSSRAIVCIEVDTLQGRSRIDLQGCLIGRDSGEKFTSRKIAQAHTPRSCTHTQTVTSWSTRWDDLWERSSMTLAKIHPV